MAFTLQPNQDDELKKRVYWFALLLLIPLMLIVSVLFSLQIIKGPDYELRAKTNREQFAILPAIRGVVYDRTESTVLAYNRRSFAVSIVPQNFPSEKERREKLVYRLSVLLKTDKDELYSIIQKDGHSRFHSYVIKADVPFEDIVFLAEHNKDFPGIYWKSKPIRVYPFRDMLSHVIGYVGLISEKEFFELSERGYNIESVIGKSGVEKVYDAELKGKDGYIRRIVDATNQVSAEIIDKGAEPVPGNNIILTIDKRIQDLAEEALGTRTGAIVVSKPSTGEILAMVSYPRFDPNLFVSQTDRDTFKKLALDPRRPFLNRTIQAQYPGGSIFKLIVALAILDSDQAIADKKYVCGGGYRLGNRFFSCWKNHGKVGLYKALVESCDSYFYQASLMLGPEVIATYAKQLGLGQRVGIDLPGEVEGIVPDPEWKRENRDDLWYDGDTLNFSIGQGYLLVTLLQFNALTNLIANRGVLLRPYVVKEVRSAKNDEVLFRKTPEIIIKSEIEQKHFDFIINAMRGVVTEGTARWGGAVLSTEMAGKTSSAEISGQEETHAWFTAFAPYNPENPDEMVSITIIVEHGGGGGVEAAPIASEIIEAIFSKSNLEEARKNIWIKRGEIYKKQRKKQEGQTSARQDQSAEEATGTQAEDQSTEEVTETQTEDQSAEEATGTQTEDQSAEEATGTQAEDQSAQEATEAQAEDQSAEEATETQAESQ